jgi:hypothetical protein
MKVIKDMKENILRLFFSGKVMNIVDNQDIDHLVEMNEIILVIVLYRVDELIDKLVCRHIQDCLIRETILDLQPD